MRRDDFRYSEKDSKSFEAPVGVAEVVDVMVDRYLVKTDAVNCVMEDAD